MSEWQPIETAPRDGTRLVTFTSARLLTITYWIKDANRWCMFTKDRPPTHWLPLPAIPKREDDAP